MEIVILGAGNIATHLAKALKNKGFTIVQIYSRTAESAKALSDILNTPYITEIDDLYKNAAVYIYALKDSALATLISQINVPEAIHVHTAGSVSLNIFKDKTSRYGVIYPLQTFSKAKNIDFENIPLLVEGNNAETTKILMDIANRLSTQCFQVNSEQRAKLHLSAVFACNFTNYMYAIAEELVTESNLPFDILKPLIAETADKIKNLSPKLAQTGPAVRYDANILEKHIAMLKHKPELMKIYEELSEQIHKRATTNQ